MRILIATVLLFTQVTFAECPESVQLIEKNQLANCTGFLYSPEADEKANDIYDEWEYLKTVSNGLKEKNDIYTEQNKILEQRLDLYIKQSNEFAKQLTKKENNSGWQKALYFTLGILATGAAVSAAKKF